MRCAAVLPHMLSKVSLIHDAWFKKAGARWGPLIRNGSYEFPPSTGTKLRMLFQICHFSLQLVHTLLELIELLEE